MRAAAARVAYRSARSAAQERARSARASTAGAWAASDVAATSSARPHKECTIARVDQRACAPRRKSSRAEWTFANPGIFGTMRS